MNIEDLTLKQLRELQVMVADAPAAQPQSTPKATTSPHVGRYVVVRTYASGVHCGVLVSREERNVQLKAARRLWRFDVKGKGISLSEVALYGSTGERSRICSTLEQIEILDALEIIPCTRQAEEQLRNAPITQAT